MRPVGWLVLAAVVLASCGERAPTAPAPVPDIPAPAASVQPPSAWRHDVVVIDSPPSLTGDTAIPLGVAFTELVPSWNIEAPQGGHALIDVRVAPSESDEWSPWVRVGHVGAPPQGDAPVRRWEWGSVAVDTVLTDRPCMLAQVRVSASPGVRVHRLALAATQDLGPMPAEAVSSPPAAAAETVRYDVPFRSQHTERPELAGRLCSPTSLAMVLAYHGSEGDVQRVADLVLDPDFDLYGNWPRNVQAAFELGVPGYVARFSDWAEVERSLAQHGPMVISLQAQPGELPGAPYESTEGHLIVLRGFDEAGHALVSDPAVGLAQEGELLYSRAALTVCWFGRAAGTAYVFDRQTP